MLYNYFALTVSFCSFLYCSFTRCMEDLFFLSLSTTQEILTRHSDINRTTEDLSSVFQAILAEQEQAEGFSTFVRMIKVYFQTEDWKDIIPFLKLASSRNMSSPNIVGPSIDLNDFLAVNKPYFYSYDNEGNPFIAFALNQNGKVIKKTLFFSKTAKSISQVDANQFLAIACLFYQGSCFIRYNGSVVEWTLAKINDINSFTN